MTVSVLGFKVIKNAIQIRLNRGESLEEVLASYPKLSTEQTNIARKEFENYTPKEGE